MTISTIFTLFVVPSMYVLLAAKHKKADHAEDADPAHPADSANIDLAGIHNA